MLSKLFKKKPKGPITINGKDYKVNYKLLHETLSHDYVGLLSKIDEAIDERISLLQKIEKLEANNAHLGNAMFEIINSETKVSNGTTKRIINLAKAAVGSCTVV